VHPATSWRELRARGRHAAGGKGTTEAQGRASALGESLERYCSSWDGTEPSRTASYADLASSAESVLHPHACMLFSDAQYAERKRTNSGRDTFKSWVPRPYPEEEPIPWCRVWSLTRAAWVWVPVAYAYLGTPQEKDRHYLVGESNGNAAGSSVEDAVLQGFLELVERESVALWWYNQLPRAGVRLEGIDNGWAVALRDHYASVGRDVWVLDLTADLKIPAFVAISRATGDGPDEVTMGFGAHLDARIGVQRALAEMNQLAPSALREIDRPDRPAEATEDERTSFHLRVDETPYLQPDPSQPSRTLDDFPMLPSDDLGELARRCQATVEAGGMEMLVHDLTRPDIGLPVVKVMVPGMRHFWPRFAPGRLYDVPVTMGWLPAARQERELNPVQLNG
jgi:ribosomal protein S12 methylthiotransferase accessory factor